MIFSCDDLGWYVSAKGEFNIHVPVLVSMLINSSHARMRVCIHFVLVLAVPMTIQCSLSPLRRLAQALLVGKRAPSLSLSRNRATKLQAHALAPALPFMVPTLCGREGGLGTPHGAGQQGTVGNDDQPGLLLHDSP